MKARIKASLNEFAQTAFDDEVNRQLEERSKEWYADLDALILYVLHEEFGFGRDRLMRFFYSLIDTNEALIDHYRLKDTEFVCKTKLREIGVDIDRWNADIRQGVRLDKEKI